MGEANLARFLRTATQKMTGGRSERGRTQCRETMRGGGEKTKNRGGGGDETQCGEYVSWKGGGGEGITWKNELSPR